MRRAVAAAVLLSMLVAGCVTTPGAPSARDNAPAHPTPGASPSPVAGAPHEVVLHAQTSATSLRPGEWVNVTFTAINKGPDARIPRGTCPSTGPWTISVLNETGHQLVADEWHLMGRCAPADPPLEDFPARAERSHNFTWNGHHLDNGTWTDAPPGRYRVRATFGTIFVGERHGYADTEAVVHVLAARERPSNLTVFEPGDARNATADGIRLTGDREPMEIRPGENVTARFEATNVGEDAVVHGLCATPWAFEVLDAHGEPMRVDPPMAHCLALTREPFPAGATLRANATWDGRHVEAEGENAPRKPAPPGTYVLRMTFTAWRGEAQATVRLDLPVRVLDP